MLYGVIFLVVYFGWIALMIVQQILGYGTAYRLTKMGGDNGISLYGWMLLMGLAAMVPGLGIWLYRKYRYHGENQNPTHDAMNRYHGNDNTEGRDGFF